MRILASKAASLGLLDRGFVCFVAAIISFFWASLGAAHGAVESPASRTYACRFLEIDDPMCQLAWGANPQALYDWMEVNLGDVAGRHREQVPDGTLCGAGREKYTAFDVPGPWPATSMQPDEEGLYPVTFHATAPHEARYFRFYLTREGFDPLTERLDWDDLELVFDSGRVSVHQLVEQPHYTFRMPLPDREGRAILYLVWQRSDSPEAFYGCSDIMLSADEGEARVPGPVLPPAMPDPVDPMDPPPAMPGPGLGEVSAVVDLYDDWGAGACGEAIVSNEGPRRVVWEVNVDLPGTMTHLWDAEIHESNHPQSHHSALPHAWRVVGADWNRTLGQGDSTTFGFCLDRTLLPEPPDPEPPVLIPLPPVDERLVFVEVGGQRWWNGFTAQLAVHNDTVAPLDEWEFRFRSSHSVAGAPWGISIEGVAIGEGLYEYTVRGAGWAQAIPAGGVVHVGFNGSQGQKIGHTGPLSAGLLFDGEAPGG